ncbi:MAG: TetR family transcriptional regulator [Streptosporangiales bacterium]|nr:TetR family transcriptional regulator [Streptosporangiales bacterium]
MPRLSAASAAEHRAAVRERIFAALRRLSVSHGLERISFADLAAEAGISRSVVYNYFPDKQSLLVAYTEREIARFLDGFASVRAQATTATERVARYVRLQLEDYRAHPQPAGPELAPLLGPEAHRRLQAHIEPLNRALTDIIAEGVERGEFSCEDPAMAAALVHGCLGAERIPLARRAHDLEDAVARVTAFVLGGLGAGTATEPRRSP